MKNLQFLDNFKGNLAIFEKFLNFNEIFEKI